MTPELLRAATGCTAERAALYADPLSAACAFYGIDTPARLAAFLAQIGHESGAFRWTSEHWGPTAAQRTYEGRKSLGNTQPGDGERFKGHGLIQTTGRYNHARVRDRLRERFPHLDVPDFEAEPERLAEPQWACLSAADYWDDKGLNALADAGMFEQITRRINGGLNGLADRIARWERAKRAIPAAPVEDRYIQTENTTPASVKDSLTPATTEPLKEPAMPILLTALAQSLISIFAPLAQEKISRELARHTDSPQVAEQVSAAIIDTVTQATGKDDPIDAVAAAKADPAVIKQAETSALDTLDRLAPLFDKLAQWDKQVFDDAEAGRGSAAARVATLQGGEPPFLRFGAWFAMSFIQFLSLLMLAISTAGALTLAVLDKLDSQLLGAVVTLMLIGGFTGVREFWLGGSRGSSAKDATIAALTSAKQ